MAKILLIEDDDILRQAYDALLSKQGYDIVIAKDGVEGLAQAEATQPDLILLDMLMPRSSGLEFLQQYQPKTKHPDVKVVVLSNVEEPFYKALEYGAVDYWIKSDLSAQEVVELVKKTLAGKT